MEKRDVRNSVKRHRDYIFLLLSFLMVLIIFINSYILCSPFVGTFASIVYILINGKFVGEAFFKGIKLRLPLGILLLIGFLGIGGWLFVIFHRLTLIETMMVLCIVSPLSFFLCKLESIKKTLLRKLRGRFG